MDAGRSEDKEIMLDKAEILAALSDLDTYFSGEDKHVDSGLAQAAVNALEDEIRPAVIGIQRRDKGRTEIHRIPDAGTALELVIQIRQSIDLVEPMTGKQACAALRQLAEQQRWV